MPLSSSYRDEFDEAIAFAEREQLAEPGALSMRELPGMSSGDEFDEAIASLSVEPQRGLAIARPQTPGTEHGFLGEITAGLGRGALRVAATPAYLADVAGEAVGWESLEKFGERGAERVEKFIEESPGLKKSASISGDIRKNPQLWKDPNWYASIVSEGIPTVFSMLIPGMGAARGAKAIGWGVKGVRAARVAGGLGAAMGLEAGGAAEQARQYEKATTGEEIPIGKKLQAVIGTGVVAGALEYVPIFRIFGKSAGKKLVRRVLEAMATEGSTEGAQEIVANHFAKVGYDADIDMAQGIIESIVGGVLIGGGMGGIAGPARTMQDQLDASTTPENVERISHVIEEGENEALLDRFRKGSAEDLVSLRQSPEGAEYAKELDQVIGEKQVEPVYSAAQKRVGILTPQEKYEAYQPEAPKRGPTPRKEVRPRALPPGQGFDLLPPKLKTRPRKVPPTYPEGAEYVAGKVAPEELDVDYKPALTKKEKPFKKKENALRALKSKRLASRGITPETHEVVSVEDGFGIAEKAEIIEPEIAPKIEQESIVVRALKDNVTDIDQLSDGEVKALNKAVKDGVLEKARGGSFPLLKTVYAKPGYDFEGKREKALSRLKVAAKRDKGKVEAPATKKAWYINEEDKPVWLKKGDETTGLRGPYSKTDIIELTGIEPKKPIAKEIKLEEVSKKVKAETPTMLKESDKVNDVTLGTLVKHATEDPAKALEHATDATVSKAKLIEGLKNKGLKAMGEARTKEERSEIKKNLEETLRGIEEGKPWDITKQERRWIVDSKTKDVLASATGKQDKVDLPIPLDRKIIDIHTHPGEEMPSDYDWGRLGWSDVTEMRVVTPGGKVYGFKKPSGFKLNPRQLRERHSAIENEIFESGRSKKMSVNEILEAINAQLVKETGVIFETKSLKEYKGEMWAEETLRGIEEGRKPEEPATAKEVKAKDPIPDLLTSKKKAGINYEMEVTIAETGETATITKDAAVALRETKEELSKWEKFLACLT